MVERQIRGCAVASITNFAAAPRSPCDVLRLPPRIYRRCCIRVPEKIIRDPDPSTYDQQLVYSGGGAPTFNNPDLDTVSLWPLKPIDNLHLKVRNLSAEASANQTRVDFSWTPWGIGFDKQPIASVFVDLARAGFAGSEKQVDYPLPPAVAAAGRYGIFVKVIHPYDRDVTNNEGGQTADGFQTSQGRAKTFVIPVRNPTGSFQTITLSAGPASVAPWVVIAPATVTLGPYAQANVMASVTVPAAIPASPPGTLISATVDILARMGGAYLGGVAILILFDA